MTSADIGDPPTPAVPPAAVIIPWLRELGLTVVGALIIAVLLRTFIGQAFTIPTGSMENTLLPGDKVFAARTATVHRGDVVVFADPGGWLSGERLPATTNVGRALQVIGLPTSHGTEHLAKRVIGMPGDVVVCCDAHDQITVNGVALDETGYLYTDRTGRQAAASNITFSVVVPAGRVFVLGDHRDNSADSRCHFNDPAPVAHQGAFVPLDDVVGPAVVIAGPFSRARRLHVPGAFAVVPQPGPAPLTGKVMSAPFTC